MNEVFLLQRMTGGYDGVNYVGMLAILYLVGRFIYNLVKPPKSKYQIEREKEEARKKREKDIEANRRRRRFEEDDTRNEIGKLDPYDFM